MKSFLSDFTGAFADGAILFPLLAALSLKGGFSATALLFTAGLAYLAAGIWFRVPMAIQPLKSIAIAAISIGAGLGEIRASGALLGLVCLGLTCFDVNRLGQRVPRSLIHGLQAALGVLLILQGAKFDSSFLALLLVAIMVGLPALVRFPVLGVVATLGLAWTVVNGALHPQLAQPTTALPHHEAFRPAIVAALVFPQIALTLGNSVVGTEDVARRYFGERASRVTIRALLTSIGLGNLVSAAIGGLPYCHGSGGVTAHVRGGARHWRANAIIGGFLLALAAAQALGGHVRLEFPAMLIAALLASTGVFHIGLAKPTWDSLPGKLELAVMALTAAFTRNMLLVLAVGVAYEMLQVALFRSRLKTKAEALS
ncbi:MAG: hypothetical protein HY074_04845 [Deltaproteobacteria bacterium]|nr:hypothetical protein [Deltaproteobacteria bacterium]